MENRSLPQGASGLGTAAHSKPSAMCRIAQNIQGVIPSWTYLAHPEVGQSNTTPARPCTLTRGANPSSRTHEPRALERMQGSWLMHLRMDSAVIALQKPRHTRFAVLFSTSRRGIGSSQPPSRSVTRVKLGAQEDNDNSRISTTRSAFPGALAPTSSSATS